MYPRRTIEFVIVVASFVLLGGDRYAGPGAGGRLLADEPPPLPSQEQGEVLNRGPVNEAFAEPVSVQVQAPLVAPKEPPAAITEDPPAQRPEGENFVWVPGYWAWDADRGDYIWVSACWRAAPPNRVWVPGYWAPITEARAKSRGVHVSVGGIVDVQVGTGRPVTEEVIVGWEWIPGFWAPAGLQEIEYLPAPPATEDIEPPGAPPQVDVVWIPGCWYWRDGRYVHRPGYWLREQPGWVWVPSHYVWTPRGYIFVDGHWDYALDRRGVLFAPVYFPRALYSRAGFRYSPTVVIDVGGISGSLFTDPRYCHYYFGDYYDDAYLRAGIYPWFECERNHTWCDPIYQYDHWQNGRADPKWAEHQQKEYELRRDDRNLRPPRTYREMEAALPKLSEPQRKNIQFTHTLTAAVSDKNATLKFGQINADERQKIVNQSIEVHKFREERGRLEGTTTFNPKTDKPLTETTTPPLERKGPVGVPSDLKGTTAHAPAFVAPPDVHLSQSEKVRMTPPLFLGKPAGPAGADKGLPPAPPDELKHKIEVKDLPKDTGGRRGG